MYAKSRNPTSTRAIVLVGFVFLVGAHAPAVRAAEAAFTVDLSNGISARIFTPEYLMIRTTYNGSRGTITLANGDRLDVITDINDPVIANKGDGAFHPFAVDQVVELLGEIAYPELSLDVEVYLLPFPRADIPVSSTLGRRLYLSPQVYEVPRSTAAYIIAHEMGHVFQERYFPVRVRDGWQGYRRIRDIEDGERYSSQASHADRPREIFAEDFRVLFGGPSAYFNGYVENMDLISPELVPDLKGFFVALRPVLSGGSNIIRVGNYPNPFNPETVVRVELDVDFLARGELLTIRVYDVRGALVRELYGGRPTGLEVRVRWDGRDRNGTEVASATYFAVARVGNDMVSRKLLMIK
ncbi:MAG: hypothetical protein V3V49_07695 [Candidatus Krumholzibacteria bacterium]